MVEMTKCPPGLTRDARSSMNNYWLSTCQSTSIAATKSYFCSGFLSFNSSMLQFKQDKLGSSYFISYCCVIAYKQEVGFGSIPSTLPWSLAKLQAKNPAPQPTSKISTPLKVLRFRVSLMNCTLEQLYWNNTCIQLSAFHQLRIPLKFCIQFLFTEVNVCFNILFIQVNIIIMTQLSSDKQQFEGQFLAKPQLFNESFYKEKQNQIYFSLQLAKKYVVTSGLTETISKAYKSIIEAPVLPLNPYSMIFRSVQGNSISLALEQRYKDACRIKLMASAVSPSNIVTTKINNVRIFVASSLYPYLNAAALLVVYDVFYSSRHKEVNQRLQTQYRCSSEKSFGGPLVLDLTAPLQQVKEEITAQALILSDSVYSAEAMLTITQYLNFSDKEQRVIQRCAKYIVGDALQLMQHTDSVSTCFFQALQIVNLQGEYSSLLQFGSENFVYHRQNIQSQIKNAFNQDNNIIRVKINIRLNNKTLQFMTVSKRYILIIQSSRQMIKIKTQDYISNACKEVFFSDKFLKQTLQLQTNLNEKCKRQLVKSANQCLLEQSFVQIGWNLFYIGIYFRSKIKKQEKNQQFLAIKNEKSISYLLFNPLHKLLHLLRSGRIAIQNKAANISQKAAFQIVYNFSKQLGMLIQKREFAIFQEQLLLPVAKEISDMILEMQGLKIKKNNLIQTYNQLYNVFHGVIESISFFIFSIDHSLFQYLKMLKQNFLNSIEQIQFCSYQGFLKCQLDQQNKFDIQNESKIQASKLKGSQKQAKNIIRFKYIEHFRLYEIVYENYWQLFCGKKVPYPLSEFLFKIMPLAVSCDDAEKNHIKMIAFSKSTVSQIDIYQITLIENGIVFYSLDPDALSIKPLKRYKTILDVFSRFFTKKTLEQKQQVWKGIFSIKKILGERVTQQFRLHTQTVFVDFIADPSFKLKDEGLQRAIYDNVKRILQEMDKNDISIIGLFAISSEESNYFQKKELLNKLLDENISQLRYDHKQSISFQKMSKLIQFCVLQHKVIQIRCIFRLHSLITTCFIRINFYYYDKQRSKTLKNLFVISDRQNRIFQNKMDLIEWETNFKNLTNTTQNQKTSKQKNSFDIQNSLREKIQTLKGLNVKGIQKYNLKYSGNLGEAELILTKIICVIQIIKFDRRGKYNLKDIEQGLEQLHQTLVKNCIKQNNFIFSDSTSVNIINSLLVIENYLKFHVDNLSEEKQILFLQMKIIKIAKYLKYLILCYQASCMI